ncbi:MAG TPA: hypothetical protein VG603_09460, partial [Chitinophagales bacterium]|nr:hypothetical protein [Chitinophagales bacterium]
DSVKIEIFNSGTENDSYEVSTVMPDEKEIIFSKTSEVKAGQSVTVALKPVAGYNGNKYTIAVKSKTNPDFVRRITLTYNK